MRHAELMAGPIATAMNHAAAFEAEQALVAERTAALPVAGGPSPRSGHQAKSAFLANMAERTPLNLSASPMSS